MSTATLVPTADFSIPAGWANDASGTTNLYLSIKDTIGSGDATYVTGSYSGGATGKFTLGTTPGGVGTVTGVQVNIRVSAFGKTPLTYWNTARIYKSDGTTALTAVMTFSGVSSTVTTFTFNPSLSGPVTYSDWAGCVLAMTLTQGASGLAYLYDANLVMTYTAAAGGPLLCYTEQMNGGFCDLDL